MPGWLTSILPSMTKKKREDINLPLSGSPNPRYQQMAREQNKNVFEKVFETKKKYNPFDRVTEVLIKKTPKK